MKSDSTLSNRFSLKDKVIVITGAAGLLGQQHAEAVASAGGIPVLLDLNLERAEEAATRIADTFEAQTAAYAVDITREQEIASNCKAVNDRFGKIDGLINNAANNPKMEKDGGLDFSRLENFPLETWNQDVAVGLTGAFLCSKHYGKAIAENPSGGVILNIASDLGLIAPDQRIYSKEGLPDDQQPVKPVTYSVTKAGLIGLTRYLATYWPENVRANVLCPGGVENNQPADFVVKLTNLIPQKRMARKDEYQGAVIFLLSESSAYVNGAVIPMEGGRTVW